MCADNLVCAYGSKMVSVGWRVSWRAESGRSEEVDWTGACGQMSARVS